MNEPIQSEREDLQARENREATIARLESEVTALRTSAVNYAEKLGLEIQASQKLQASVAARDAVIKPLASYLERIMGGGQIHAPSAREAISAARALEAEAGK